MKNIYLFQVQDAPGQTVHYSNEYNLRPGDVFKKSETERYVIISIVGNPEGQSHNISGVVARA
jgi:hypothetical protein